MLQGHGGTSNEGNQMKSGTVSAKDAESESNHENIQQTQAEGHSAKYSAHHLQKCQGFAKVKERQKLFQIKGD